MFRMTVKMVTKMTTNIVNKITQDVVRLKIGVSAALPLMLGQLCRRSIFNLATSCVVFVHNVGGHLHSVHGTSHIFFHDFLFTFSMILCVFLSCHKKNMNMDIKYRFSKNDKLACGRIKFGFSLKFPVFGCSERSVPPERL